ncbi:alcohol dehydrogenase [Scytonema sp. NUACC26]|uniref:alcohol dehydrogenase n=1 Tax=Scytonema sp. NUACC26 TaxID=3140176 RepID=UPI0034DBADAD
MALMKAVQVSRPGGDFEVVEREIPEPQHNQVRVKIEACGICHGDVFVKEGFWHGLKYPRIPGHEIVGSIDKVGEGVTTWQQGQRVGVGWHGGHCFQCEPCLQGDFSNCQNSAITGIDFDGGYAEYTVVPSSALARIPDDLSSIEAAPLLCAGITTFNALRNSGARVGDIVAVQGVGGLGHLALQFARKMGFKTVAISRGQDKKTLALEMGATDYIDTELVNPAQTLIDMGGAKVILATAPNSKAISSLVNGLTVNGKLLIVGASGEPLEISPIQLIKGRKSVQGWHSGHAKDSEETLSFCMISEIRPLIEVFSLENVAEAYKRMLYNKARFRVVLQISS